MTQNQNGKGYKGKSGWCKTTKKELLAQEKAFSCGAGAWSWWGWAKRSGAWRGGAGRSGAGGAWWDRAGWSWAAGQSAARRGGAGWAGWLAVHAGR
jgi:hypothetical protein